jgi:hypothetical protein
LFSVFDFLPYLSAIETSHAPLVVGRFSLNEHLILKTACSSTHQDNCFLNLLMMACYWQHGSIFKLGANFVAAYFFVLNQKHRYKLDPR